MTEEKQKYALADALQWAVAAQAALAPDCYQIQIAGSIRRQKAKMSDIEIVLVPKPYDVGLFASGIAATLSSWHKFKGELPCKYTRRLMPGCDIPIDIFIVEEPWFGYHLALRTGSADFSKRIVTRLGNMGWRMEYGKVYGRKGAKPLQDEQSLFTLLGWDYIEPVDR